MAEPQLAAPPVSLRGVVADVYHGVEVRDPYRWLEAGETPAVADWVAAHNQRTRAALDGRPSWDRWHQRLSSLISLPTAQSLSVHGEQLFVLERAASADQYSLVVRSAVDPTVPARTLLDPAALAADGAVAIDWFQPSPTGNVVAYGLSEGGSENSVLHVMEVATGEVDPLRIPNARAASVGWLPDTSGFYYAVYPEGDEYNRHIRFHRRDTDVANDPVVFDRLPTPESWPDVATSRDGRYVLVHVMVAWTRIDVHLLDTTTSTWTTVIEGVDATTSLQFDGDSLVGITMRDAPNGRVVRAPLHDPSAWTTIVPERDDAVLTPFGGFAPFGDELLVTASSVAVDRVERWPSGDAIDLGVAGVAALDADDGRAFIAVSTFGAPISVRRFTAADGLQPWGDAIDSSLLPDLKVTQVFYPSLDGTTIPMFVIHRVDITPSPQTPLILNGYGGFAIAETPAWMPYVAAWCGAGGVFCIAGMRGGYEYGDAWHHAGRRANKQRVFDDFHAAGDWLVAQGYTSREMFGITGRSNGGLLMGAAITQRPDLARAVWCGVPLLDMVRFPQFLIARLWTDEYGDPDVAEEFGWLYAYSPYHHVQPGDAYPAVLFTTAESDGRVDSCHARKMTALLTWANSSQSEHPILLLQHGRAGHGVGKPASMVVNEGADALTFFSWQLGADSLVIEAARR